MTPGSPPPSRATTDAPRVLHLLTQQRDLYRKLRDLSTRQAELIEQGQTESLLKVLSMRQELVEALTGLGQQLDPYRDRLTGMAERLPAPERDQLRGLVDEVQELLQGIIAQDEKDRAQLQSHHRDTGRSIGRTAEAGSAMAAYRHSDPVAARPQTTPRFTDSRG